MRVRGFLLGAVPRQEDAERRAAARLGIDIDEAAGLLDDAVNRGEAETGALADLLVEKNGSKILSMISARMPVPVSVMSIRT